MVQTSSQSLLDRIITGLILVVFVGVTIHAPLTVWLGTLYPDAALGIKAWKEVLIAIAFILLLVETNRLARWQSVWAKGAWWVVAYATLHLLLVSVFFLGWQQAAAGLMIDLRYVVFGGLVYAATLSSPGLRRILTGAFIGMTAVVTLFAVLQATVLPRDILSAIGYGPSTIAPYLTIDQNEAFVRVNSTLRGPNPLGAFAIISGLGLLAAALFGKTLRGRGGRVLMAALGATTLVSLWVSYSRSAWIGFGVGAVALLLLRYGRRLSRAMWVAGIVGLLLAGGLVYSFRDSSFVAHVLLHENPSEGNALNSNEGHAESLMDGLVRMGQQPLGAGVGSTGSASLLGDSPVIIENHYLYVAHEVGWVGLALFVVMYAGLLWRLWLGRREWLSAALLASGIGLAIVGLLLPVWADDTVSIIWWGLAGAALATSRSNKYNDK